MNLHWEAVHQTCQLNFLVVQATDDLAEQRRLLPRLARAATFAGDYATAAEALEGLEPAHGFSKFRMGMAAITRKLEAMVRQVDADAEQGAA